MPVTSVQFGQYPWHYANGLGISNDATTPHSILDVAVGDILDSTGTYQISLTAPVKVSSAFNGFGGLDTGTVADSTVYAVYLVGDPVDLNPTGLMLSKSLTGPLMPFGYSVWSLIGYATTDSSGYFLLGYWSAGNSTTRTFTYDAFQATAVTGGSSATYANVKLNTLVPLVNNLPVQLYTVFYPGAASDTASLQCGNGTGDQTIITGQVEHVNVTTISTILAQNVTITSVVYPVINYKVSGTDTLAVDVAGYTFFI